MELRRYHREFVAGKVRVNWMDSHGRSFGQLARCLDISRRGLKLEVDSRVDPGTLVNVESKDFKIAGIAEIRYCRPKGLKYVIGIQYQGGLEWRVPGDQKDLVTT
jgi:hypothetical protein